LRPSDIDIVKAGLPVQVQFSAYTGRRTNRVMGKVAMVSADRPVDNKGQPGFRADIEVDEAEVERIAGLLLYPGMSADAFIETGRHTFARYLMAPILDGILRRVRER
jgi:multidrug efflux pump subunit AcrA (membrane-fusion protein)